jgi:hypothetical protein
MCLKENTAGNMKQIVQSPANQLLPGKSYPVQKGLIGLENAAIRQDGQVAARCILVEVL